MKSQKRRNHSGFTLLELLVATAIMVIMIGFLVVIVRSAMNTWKTSEDRSALFAQARSLFEIFQEDLSSVTIPQSVNTEEIKFLCDHDMNWRTRLRLVRSIKGEAQWWLTREAGRQLLADKYIDSQNDADEANRALLRPSGGLMEVAYFMDSDPKSTRLFRAIRTPIGGEGSILDEKNLTTLTNVPCLADNVLYLEYRFWSPWTATWDLPLGQNIPKEEIKKSPLTYWDSTRRTLSSEKYKDEKEKFPLLWPEIQNVGIPLLPSRVMITLVLRDPGFSPEEITLGQNISKDEKSFTLNSTAKIPQGEYELPYILIDNEWIRYEKVEGRKILLGERGSRGSRMTLPAQHTVGAPVEIGKTFRWILNLPCQNWNYREKW